jgi:hypothetical protein
VEINLRSATDNLRSQKTLIYRFQRLAVYAMHR